ncbi:MAG TPA: 3-hydroxyacyl-ACP dehydratase FabZ [Alphaproteobacteria bacterium]|nr:3-hydroxyacyl-ACP dehydratase FabZ [Alphaproteobacteria bacterium]
MKETEVEEAPLEAIDVSGVMEMIPHRYPFLLVDRVIEILPDRSAVGIKNVTINESFFHGHFPGRPVMPGVLIIEAMAQTAAVLVVRTLGKAAAGKLVYFMSIDNARFRRPVTPGDQLRIHVVKERSRANVWRFNAAAKVDGRLVAEATYAAMLMDR